MNGWWLPPLIIGFGALLLWAVHRYFCEDDFEDDNHE